MVTNDRHLLELALIERRCANVLVKQQLIFDIDNNIISSIPPESLDQITSVEVGSIDIPHGRINLTKLDGKDYVC